MGYIRCREELDDGSINTKYEVSKLKFEENYKRYTIDWFHDVNSKENYEKLYFVNLNTMNYEEEDCTGSYESEDM